MNPAYDQPFRSIEAEILIAFPDAPLIVTSGNYLQSFNILEELGADSSSNPIGTVSANELELKLFNDGGLFSPSNPDSIYFGKMKIGIPIYVKIKTAEQAEWDSLGVFYVSEWKAEVTGLVATISCYCQIFDILNKPLPFIPVEAQISMKQAFIKFFLALAIPVQIEEIYEQYLTYWYALTSTAETLNSLCSASLSAIVNNHEGNITIIDTSVTKEVVATLTDETQIISASIVSNLNKEFDGLDISVNKTQLSNSVEVLNIQNLEIPQGIRNTEAFSFTSRPVAWLDGVVLDSNSELNHLKSFSYTSEALQALIDNPSEYLSNGVLLAYGRIIETIKTIYNQYGNNPLKLDNLYVQTTQIVERLNLMLDKYIRSELPTLTLSIRGNPTLNLGDKITVISTKYHLNFTGILQRAEYNYSGALSCTITLINSSLLEVT